MARAAADQLRARGRRTRGALVTAAECLWSGRTIGEVSVAQIAAAAGAFPHQVTYYFGSKEGLFVEIAFRSLLRDTADLEQVGREATDPDQFNVALSIAAVRMASVSSVAEALLIVRRRPELATIAQYGLRILFRQSKGYLARMLTERGWKCTRPLQREAQAFWHAVFGAVLFDAVPGPGRDQGLISDVMTVQATDG